MPPEETEVQEQPSLEDVSDKAFDKMNETPKEDAPEVPETPAPEENPDDKGKGEGEIDAQTLSDLKAGKIIPHHRFNEILERMKMYESFGPPEEVAQKLKAIAEKAKETPAPETPAEETAEDKETRAYLLQLFPALAKFPDIQKALEQMSKDAKERQEAEQSERSQKHLKIVTAGTAAIKDLATKAGIDVKAERALNLVCVGVTNILNNDPALRERFYIDGDVTAVNEAFDDYFKTLFPGVQRKAASDILNGKNKQRNLPKPPVSGGAPEEPIHKPKTLQEVGDLAWDKMHSA